MRRHRDPLSIDFPPPLIVRDRVSKIWQRQYDLAQLKKLAAEKDLSALDALAFSPDIAEDKKEVLVARQATVRRAIVAIIDLHRREMEEAEGHIYEG